MTRRSRLFGVGILLGAALLLSGSALAAHHEEAAKGAVVVGEQVTLNGKVVSIDAATRTVVVEGELGRQVSIVAPQEGPKFDQIAVGDPVVAVYTESIALAIAPVADAEAGITRIAAVSTAPPGETPAAVMAEQIELRAVVKAVDVAKRQVTLDVPSGGERTLKVGDAVDIERVKTGEQVSVTLTRALAVSIVNKLLHAPLSRLRAQTGREEGLAMLEAARELFALDDASAPGGHIDADLRAESHRSDRVAETDEDGA